MTAGVERYLAKAQESLASARADLDAARFNSAANRAYYGAFQAAVAMLLASGVNPRGDSWEHRFVIAEFSGTLVRRRKMFGAEFRRIMQELFELRLQADYRITLVSRREARRAVDDASRVVTVAAGRPRRREGI